MSRVDIIKTVFNIFTMQVCAVDDASDEEILSVCNRENPSSIENGWSVVLRNSTCDGSFGREENKRPVACSMHPGRTHLLVLR